MSNRNLLILRDKIGECNKDTKISGETRSCSAGLHFIFRITNAHTRCCRIANSAGRKIGEIFLTKIFGRYHRIRQIPRYLLVLFPLFPAI